MLDFDIAGLKHLKRLADDSGIGGDMLLVDGKNCEVLSSGDSSERCWFPESSSMLSRIIVPLSSGRFVFLMFSGMFFSFTGRIDSS